KSLGQTKIVWRRGGIRYRFSIAGSGSYRLYVAGDAVVATVAGAPCTILHDAQRSLCFGASRPYWVLLYCVYGMDNVVGNDKARIDVYNILRSIWCHCGGVALDDFRRFQIIPGDDRDEF